MTASSTIRVLQDPSLDGPTNMARDEALMLRVGRAQSPPTLRLYEWAAATISLGYFQRFADYESLPSPAGALPVVRRLTGGGAILHDCELTYSLTLPIDHPLMSRGPNYLYEVIHDAVIAALKTLGVTSRRGGETDDSGAARGPFFCFSRRHCYDVLVGGRKIAGSAQRRTREAVLQHGSIVLENRYDQQETAVVPGDSLQTLPRLRTAIVEHCQVLGVDGNSPESWSADELGAVDVLIAKYSGEDWTQRT